MSKSPVLCFLANTTICRWKETLEACLGKVEGEIKTLKDEKFSTERELDALGIPLGVVSECISMRDCRQGAELTYDEGDTELKKVETRLHKQLFQRVIDGLPGSFHLQISGF